MSNEMTLTIVVPAKNEEHTIRDVLTDCFKYTKNILVVDGHSTDATVEIARSLGAEVIFDNRKGKGDAIRCAIPYIKGDIVVFIDADGSHDPNDIPKLIAPIQSEEADHVSGSRLMGGSSELHGGFDECFRLMGSSFITACINWKFKVKLSESQNGFRAFRTDILRKLKLKSDITTIEQEMIGITLSMGFRMAEVPTHEHKRKAGYSKIKLTKVSHKYVWSLIKILFMPKPGFALASGQ